MFKAEAKVGIFKEEMIWKNRHSVAVSSSEKLADFKQKMRKERKRLCLDGANQLKQTAKWASRPWIMCRDTDKTLRHVSVLFSRDVKGAMYSNIASTDRYHNVKQIRPRLFNQYVYCLLYIKIHNNIRAYCLPSLHLFILKTCSSLFYVNSINFSFFFLFLFLLCETEKQQQ